MKEPLWFLKIIKDLKEKTERGLRNKKNGFWVVEIEEQLPKNFFISTRDLCSLQLFSTLTNNTISLIFK